MNEYLSPEDAFTSFQREVVYADILVDKFIELTNPKTYLSGRKNPSSEFVIGDIKGEYDLMCCLSLERSHKLLDLKVHFGEAREHQLQSNYCAEVKAGELYDSRYQKYVAIKGGMSLLDLSDPLGIFVIDILKDISMMAKVRGVGFKIMSTNWRQVINGI